MMAFRPTLGFWLSCLRPWKESREGNAVVFGKGLHELEAHAAAAQLLERVGVVGAFGVEDGHGGGHHIVGHVMVADDKVDAQALGIGNFLDGLDAAVEYNDEFDARFVGKVHALATHSVALIVAVGDVIVDV